MSVNLSALAGAGQQFFDDNGNVLVGGKLYTYAAGTTTPLATYTSSAGDTQHTNPIVLNAAGRVGTGEIWLTAGSNYKFVLATASDTIIATWDDITGVNGTGITSAAPTVLYTPPFVGAVTSDYTVENKLSQTVSAIDFGADPTGVLNSTAAIEAAATSLVSAGGGILFFPAGTYKYTRLTIRSGVTFQGSGRGATFLVCTDSATLNTGVSTGSSMRALDNNARVVYAGFKDLIIAAGAISSVSAQQDIFRNIIGLNLCMCERTVIENVAFSGWGQGAIVLARAENGSEGLGFFNSSQDGNYNQITNVSVASCGKYNTDIAAIWLKYKANSNKFYGVYAKGLIGSGVVSVAHGNDNLFAGGTAESCAYIFKLGSGLGATGNFILQFRAESLTGDAYTFLANAASNYLFGGYHTGVTGSLFVDANGTNRVVSDRENYLRSANFPPATNYSTLHNYGALQVTSLNGDPTYPLYVKSSVNGSAAQYPYQLFWNDVSAGATGNILGRLGWRTGDTTAGAEGVSATVDAVLEGSSGTTSLVFSTGTGTTLSEKFRIRSTGAQISLLPTTAASLTTNSTMTMTLTSDTNLRISVRGSDGTTRVANITLA